VGGVIKNLYKSLTHYAKGTPITNDCFPHINSSSFHSIRDGSFHHSLTVLINYQALKYINKLEGVLLIKNRQEKVLKFK